MSRIIVFGATGFIGRFLIQELSPDTSSMVTRILPEKLHQDGRRWLIADLLNLSSIEQVLSSGATVINLAYSKSSTAEDNIKMAENLVQACIRAKISRLVHCSTAVVVGGNSSSIVNEETVCSPVTAYEKTKYEIEKVFSNAMDKKLSVYILRPTGVIGPGGKNLKKMISNIKDGNATVNFIRSSVYGARKLNLVPVNDVVKALLYLSEQTSISPGTYICSADDDADNQYDCIEKIMRELLMKQSRIRPFSFPDQVLNTLLRFSRSGGGRFPNRIYSSDKLLHAGFRRSTSIMQAVKEFVLSEQEY